MPLAYLVPGLLAVSVTSSAAAGFSSIAENEDALLRHLFQGYQKWVRPVLSSNYTIKVYFGLKISQLVDVDEKNQLMTTNVLLKQVNVHPSTVSANIIISIIFSFFLISLFKIRIFKSMLGSSGRCLGIAGKSLEFFIFFCAAWRAGAGSWEASSSVTPPGGKLPLGGGRGAPTPGRGRCLGF
ncbi:uncharacterized protein LOC130684357 isoform X1 [Manis pentadactyla]|uniref:uncharacterized protein LOC130684357 isoform X1 n=1 Tax=Manis pentadactyla TaxID=143292 RepID=UPI00255C728C|nr:uncharacterized protein LOC130684357 isoform X1 [Manis pentadactyla]